MTRPLCALFLGLGFAGFIRAADLQPLMTLPHEEVLQHNFSAKTQLTKMTWAPRQGTRWSVTDGVLRGIPSSEEFQAARLHHQGLEPRVSSPVTPGEVTAFFSVRFLEGDETPIVPFVEFGHHVARIRFSAEGISILGDHDTLKLAETTELTYEPGRWYHCLAELKGEEFVVQFADGPTLYATHPSYAKPPPSGAPGMGVAGPRGGTIELDNVFFWTVEENVRKDWPKTRATLPKFEPVRIKEKK